MLVVDSSSSTCKQCLTRRLSVMDGNNKSPCGPKASTESIRRVSLLSLIPYEYCLTSGLSLRDQHLILSTSVFQRCCRNSKSVSLGFSKVNQFSSYSRNLPQERHYLLLTVNILLSLLTLKLFDARKKSTQTCYN